MKIKLRPGTDVIQPAINALPSSGGTIKLRPGRYIQTTELKLGDGSPTSISTKHGIQIIGVPSVIQNIGATISTPSSVIIDFTTPNTTGSGFHLCGTQGWLLQDIEIIGQTAAGNTAAGVCLETASFGKANNLRISNFRHGIFSTTWPNSSSSNHDSWGNKWDNILIYMTQGSMWGVSIQSGDQVSDTDFNEFNRLIVVPYDGVYGCMHLGFCDGNVITNFNCISSQATAVPGIVFDYFGSPGPTSNYFYGLESGVHPLVNWGSPSPVNKNYIYGFSQANGGIIPALPGLTVY